MPNSLTFVSPSQVNAFLDCPRKWYAQYILKEIPYEESEAVQLGNVFHKIMELSLNAEKKGLEAKFRKPVNYISALTRRTVTPEEARKNKGGLPANNLLTHESLALLPVLCENINGYDWANNEGENTKIEHPISYMLHGVKVGGRMDRIDIRDNHVRIVDLKTGKPYSEVKIRKDWQTRLYAYEYLKMGKIVNFEFWFVRNADGKVKVSFHPEDVEEIERGADKIFSEMKRECGANWKSSGLCKFCGFYKECIKMRG